MATTWFVLVWEWFTGAFLLPTRPTHIIGMITNPEDEVILIDLLSLGSYWQNHLKGEDEKDHGR